MNNIVRKELMHGDSEREGTHLGRQEKPNIFVSCQT